MNLSRREIRVRLLQKFCLGHKATNNVCSTMAEDALSIRTVQHWLNRFKNNNFERDDLPHSGKPLERNMNLVKHLIEEGLWLTARCLAEQVDELSSHQLQHRLDACMDTMTSRRNHESLHNLITGDERRVLLVNCAHRHQWLSAGQIVVLTSPTDLHPNKVMVSVWWGVKGIIH